MFRHLFHFLLRLFKENPVSDSNPPVIDSITADNTTPTPGQLVTITVAGHDADARSVTTSFALKDGSGNTVAGQYTSIVGDPVTIDPASITVDDPAGVATASADPNNPLAILLQL